MKRTEASDKITFHIRTSHICSIAFFLPFFFYSHGYGLRKKRRIRRRRRVQKTQIQRNKVESHDSSTEGRRIERMEEKYKREEREKKKVNIAIYKYIISFHSANIHLINKVFESFYFLCFSSTHKMIFLFTHPLGVYDTIESGNKLVFSMISSLKLY